MKNKIALLCKTLEKENKIKILFAVENGSRAWRMSSKDSDYDVRFVFVRPLSEYIQINKSAEVIQTAFDKNFEKVPIRGSLIDFSGFDILKFTKMLSDSNPTVIEWLVTDMIYYGKQNETFKNFAIKNFNKIALYHHYIANQLSSSVLVVGLLFRGPICNRKIKLVHYKSMCRNNYLDYLKFGEDVTYKRYLYSFRGLINAKWVANKKSIPPISFPETLKKSLNLVPLSILQKLNETIKLKLQGKEKENIQNIVKLDNYIEEFLKDDSEAPNEKSHATFNKLNKELRKIILKDK